MNPLPVFSLPEFVDRLRSTRRPWQDLYYAMYSSVFGGIVNDPVLMLVPADDHMVHRGDAVFETLKCVRGGLYNLAAHLDRLRESAARVRLPCPWKAHELVDLVVQTTRAGGRPDCLVRILLSRGPGSFGISPADCPEPALYIITYAAPAWFMERHPQGARARRSAIPPKPPPFAGIKSVNYLPNVLMKMEALDAGVDFVLSFDERGCLAEGATENAAIVTREHLLRVPRPDRILVGTTMRRALELARALVQSGELRDVKEADIPCSAVQEASELLIIGTTPDITAATEFDGRPIGDGRPGPVFHALSRLLQDDMLRNEALRTPVF